MSNKKIGTMTFHWATNYGAVIQAYALQKYLSDLGYETEIIDYVPKRTIMINTLFAIKNRNRDFFHKERKINQFRREHLKLSEHKIGISRRLKKYANEYSHIIVGSDQVWNYSFTMGAEGRTTLSYFLDFVGQNIKKISYATSFGMDSAPQDYIDVVKPWVSRFDGISVRENTGVDIAKQLGVNAEIVCDPTLLLKREDYESLLSPSKWETGYVYSYILHGCEVEMSKIKEVVKKSHPYANFISDDGSGIIEWLTKIRDAEFVITNSFHGMMFSLLFNIPFIVVPVKGSKMNDRISTVLEMVGLLDRIVEDELSIPETTIDWETVNSKIEESRRKGKAYLERQLS